MNATEFKAELNKIESDWESAFWQSRKTAQDKINWKQDFIKIMDTARVFVFSCGTAVLIDKAYGYKKSGTYQEILDEIYSWQQANIQAITE